MLFLWIYSLVYVAIIKEKSWIWELYKKKVGEGENGKKMLQICK